MGIGSIGSHDWLAGPPNELIGQASNRQLPFPGQAGRFRWVRLQRLRLLVQIAKALGGALVTVPIPPLDTLVGPLADAARSLPSLPQDLVGLSITFAHSLPGLPFGLKDPVDGPFDSHSWGVFCHRTGGFHWAGPTSNAGRFEAFGLRVVSPPAKQVGTGNLNISNKLIALSHSAVNCRHLAG